MAQGGNSRGNAACHGPWDTVSRRYETYFHQYALDSPVERHLPTGAELHAGYQRPS